MRIMGRGYTDRVCGKAIFIASVMGLWQSVTVDAKKPG
jgi:hypothetical protein